MKDGAADIPEPLLSALQALIDAGQKIEAIKRYRFASGADLATAKGVVDALAAGQRHHPVEAREKRRCRHVWRTRLSKAPASLCGLL